MATNLKLAVSKGPRPVSTIENIGVADAKRYLAGMVINRPIDQGRVIEFATAIDEGKWVLNGETIKFDDEGRLFDGQHRLEAIILAGKAVASHVVRGVNDPRAFSTVDVGKPRGHGDIFGIAGYSSPKAASTSGLLIYYYKNRMLTMKGPRGFTRTGRELVKGTPYSHVRSRTVVPKEQLVQFCEPYREQIMSAERFCTRLRFPLIPRPVQTALFVLFSEKAGAFETESFFGALKEGVGLTSNDPVHVLRQRLIKEVASKIVRLNRYVLMALIVRAWNIKRAGKQGGAFIRVPEGEHFPTIK
jgi:hypothetical protein